MINDKIYIEYVRVLVMEEKPNTEAVANTEKKEVVTEKTKKSKKDLIINLVLIFFMLMIFIAIVIPLVRDTFTTTSRDTFIANLQEIVRTAGEKYDASSRDEIIFNNATGDSAEATLCNDELGADISDDKLLYSIIIDYKGRVKHFAATNGLYEYLYDMDEDSINYLTFDMIGQNSIRMITEENQHLTRVSLEKCSY